MIGGNALRSRTVMVPLISFHIGKLTVYGKLTTMSPMAFSIAFMLLNPLMSFSFILEAVSQLPSKPGMPSGTHCPDDPLLWS